MSPTYPYLGTPGAMVQLPGPSGGMTRTSSRGESATRLLSGGIGMVRRLHAKDAWSWPFTSRPANGLADTLSAFGRGLYGDGPFVLVDPSTRNVLGLGQSSMGLQPGVTPGWIASNATTAEDNVATVTPVAGSGVLKWLSPTPSGTLRPGSVAGTADTSRAPVYLPGEDCTVSIYAKATGSSSSALFRVDGFDATGALVASSGTSPLTTAWTRYTRTISAGSGTFASAVFILPTIITLGTGAPTNAWIAGAQVEYATTASAWQIGYRSPRVLITAIPDWASDKWDGYATHTLSLAEV